MNASPQTAVATFDNVRRASRDVRRWAEPVLRGWQVEGEANDVLLVIAELVTNAVLHGDGTVTVRLDRTERAVRVEVADEGDPVRSLEAYRPPPESVGGRGLMLVEHFSSAWGAVRSNPGTTVWAEMRIDNRPGQVCNR